MGVSGVRDGNQNIGRMRVASGYGKERDGAKRQNAEICNTDGDVCVRLNRSKHKEKVPTGTRGRFASWKAFVGNGSVEQGFW